MLESAVDHLIYNTLPSAVDYRAAEEALSRAYNQCPQPTSWEEQARLAKRRAKELAIAIDGLADRCKQELALSLTQIRGHVAALCAWPGTGAVRADCLERVRGVANAYKHQNLSDPALPITSDADILVVVPGYGLDGYGVGKFSGVEVLIQEKTEKTWKFLGDAPVAVAAWFRFLGSKGAIVPNGPFHVCGLQVHP
jgi:hypothetical protein